MSKHKDDGLYTSVDKHPLKSDTQHDHDAPKIADAPVNPEPIDVRLPDENEDERGPKAFPGGK